jgi:predicted kinase
MDQIILIIGKSCSGKTYYSKLKFPDYKIIHLDRLLINISKNLNIFNIYKNNHTSINKFYEKLKSEIKNNKKLVIEGAISNAEIINKISEMTKNIKIIYIHPKTPKDYLERIMKRVKKNDNSLTFIKNYEKAIDKEKFIKNRCLGMIIRSVERYQDLLKNTKKKISFVLN